MGLRPTATAASTVATDFMCHPPILATGCATCGSPTTSIAATTTASRMRACGRSATTSAWRRCSDPTTSGCTTAPMPGSPPRSSTKPRTIRRWCSSRTTTSRWPRGCSGGGCRRARSWRSGTSRGRPCSVLAQCPWRAALLDGLLASDIVGFQTPDDCRNFIDAVEACLDADVDRTENEVTFRGHTTRVRAYPVGIEWANPAVAALPSSAACREHVCRAIAAAGCCPPRRRRRPPRLHQRHQREVPGSRTAARTRPRPARAIRVRAGCRAEPGMPARLSRGSRRDRRDAASGSTRASGPPATGRLSCSKRTTSRRRSTGSIGPPTSVTSAVFTTA